MRKADVVRGTAAPAGAVGEKRFVAPGPSAHHAGADTMRNKGIITILVGIGLLFISILFSSGSYPKLDLMGNISRMEIVLIEGKYIEGAMTQYGIRQNGHYEGRISIPLKYLLSLSVLLILFGTGTVLLSKKRVS